MSIIAFVLLAHLGLVAHWAKKWAREQTTLSLWGWWLHVDRKASVQTYIVFLSALFGFISQSPELTAAAAYSAFSAGYLIDSVLNKGD